MGDAKLFKRGGLSIVAAMITLHGCFAVQLQPPKLQKPRPCLASDKHHRLVVMQ